MRTTFILIIILFATHSKAQTLTARDTAAYKAGMYLQQAGKNLGRAVGFSIIGGTLTGLGFGTYNANSTGGGPLVIGMIGAGLSFYAFANFVACPINLKKAGHYMKLSAAPTGLKLRIEF